MRYRVVFEFTCTNEHTEEIMAELVKLLQDNNNPVEFLSVERIGEQP